MATELKLHVQFNTKTGHFGQVFHSQRNST